MLAAALVISVTACTATTEEETSVNEAVAGETYTGTVAEIGKDYMVITTEIGDVRIALSENTEYVRAGGMGGGAEGEVPADQPDRTEGEAPANQPDGAEGEAPADLPDGAEGEVPADLPDGTEGEAPEMGNPGLQTLTYSDIALGDEVTVVVGEDGTAETVTLSGTDMGDGPGGMGGASSAPEDYDAANEYTTDTEVTGAELSSTGTDENAVFVGTEGITVSLNDVTIIRSSDDSTGGDDSSFYGVGAAALVTDGVLSISDSTIISDAAGGAGVFAYGDGVAYVSDTTIQTEQDTSGGIHVAGGGTLYAWNLTVETQGESSAAIRSDRGSGTMVVDGGVYTSNWTGSPAVYSTADITIHGAVLTATGSEAICIEGLNTIRLFDCDVSGNMSDLDQNDCTWNVILYQSMSGDSEVGNSTFEMVGGTLTAENGGMFYTTNTESTFILFGVEITCAQDSEFLLKCTGNSNQRGWGTSGANGADCHFTAIEQILEGDVIWDSISQLDFYLTEGSVLTGAFTQDETNAGNGGDGYAALYIDGSSSWIVTGDSTLSSLSCEGTITDAEGNSVSIVGTDGTVYVSGSSSFTITVEMYSDSADMSGASTVDNWDDFEVKTIG